MLSFEKKTKQLYLLLFFFIIAYILYLLIIPYYKYYFNDFLYIDEFVSSLSQILVILPYLIYQIFQIFSKNKYDNKQKIKKPISYNNKKDYIILFLNIIINFIYNAFKKSKNIAFIFLSEAILLFFLSFFMKIFNDFKLYRHRITALIMLTVFSFLMDSILFDYSDYYNLLNFYCVLLYAINYAYQQYLISVKNISFYNVCSFYGLLDFISLIIILIFGNKFGYKMNYHGKRITIATFYKEIVFKNIVNILFKSLPFIVINTIINFILYLIVYKFSIIHALIIIEFLDISRAIYLIFIENYIIIEHYYDFIILLIIFFFSIFSLFIYLEVIELKCCGLNKNTRRNILLRENMDKQEIGEIIDKECEDGNKELQIIENKKVELNEGYIVDLLNIPNRESTL